MPQKRHKLVSNMVGFDEIYSYMKHTNIPSQKVAQKNGMKFVMEYDDEKNKISKVFSITKDEYENYAK